MTNEQLQALSKAASALRFAATDHNITQAATDELLAIAAVLVDIATQALEDRIDDEVEDDYDPDRGADDDYEYNRLQMELAGDDWM